MSRDFSQRINVHADRLAGNVLEIMRDVALAVQREIVLSTPVDTGKARSNWRVTVGHAAVGVIEPYAPGSHLGRGESGNASAALNQARSELGVIKVSGKALGGFKVPNLFITNRVSYMSKLNNGSSAQAAAAFVQAGIHAGIQVAKRGRLFK